MGKSFLIGEAVEVEVADSLTQQFSTYFESELLPAGSTLSARGRVLVTSTGTVTHTPEAYFGVSGGLTQGRFVVPDGSGHWCSLDPSTLHTGAPLSAELDLCCPQFKKTVLLEWLIIPLSHFGAASLGASPVHASAVSIGPNLQEPVVFSAWSGVGKTNMLLWALAQGAAYFGDDLVLLKSNGEAIPSARPVAIYGYNRALAPKLAGREQRRLAVGDVLHAAGRMAPGRFASALTYASNALTAVRTTARNVGGTLGTTQPVLAHVLCTATSATSTTCRILEAEERVPEKLAAAHVAVMDYEYVWFQRYLQTWRWATQDNRDPWQDLRGAWQAALTEYFTQVPRVAELRIPRGSGQEGTSDAWSALRSALTAAN